MIQLSFCESVHAGPQSVDHLRVVGMEGMMLGGGFKGPTLCGRTWMNGWDTRTPVTELTVRHETTCQACAAEALKEMGKAN